MFPIVTQLVRVYGMLFKAKSFSLTACNRNRWNSGREYSWEVLSVVNILLQIMKCFINRDVDEGRVYVEACYAT